MRATGYLIHGLALTVAGAVLLFAIGFALLASFFLVGLPWLGETIHGLRWLANADRRRSGNYRGTPIDSAYRPLTGGSIRQLRTAGSDPATYRDLLWLLAQIALGFWLMLAAVIAWVGFVIAVTLPLWWWLPAEPGEMTGITLDSWPNVLLALLLNGVGFGLLLGFVLPWLAAGQAWLAKALLSPTTRARLNARVTELKATRAAALDAHAAELRRIERDLHDTSQAGLVAIAVRLGVAERQLKTDPEQAARLIREAREGAEAALAELRALVRGIYPPILSDRGLTGAVTALATAAPIPVEVKVGNLGDVPAAVEAAAYFIVAEALTNVAKHAEATAARVEVTRQNDRVILEIADNGRGGAKARFSHRPATERSAAPPATDIAVAGGTGLRGIARRVAALDGRFTVHSPAGGPTALRAELPCGS